MPALLPAIACGFKSARHSGGCCCPDVGALFGICRLLGTQRGKDGAATGTQANRSARGVRVVAAPSGAGVVGTRATGRRRLGTGVLVPIVARGLRLLTRVFVA